MVKFATSVTALLLSTSSALALPNAGPVSEARYDAVGQQLSFSPAFDNSDYPPEFIASAVDAFADAYTQAHNSFRAAHGARPLVWSPALAAKAQNWANGCVFKHGSVGENLAAGTGNYGATNAVKGWTDEITTLSQATLLRRVVWKSSTQLGCAVKQCPPGSIFPAKFGVAFYHVCEYAPPGNVIGQFPANVQK
ncbi:PR-1-like protein [Ceratobasidium sp. AG-I]|nr:PR-1-like protein [Ceratobasidium sp. AG-I]